MEESTARVAMALVLDSPADCLVASRLLGHPRAYRRWEEVHDRLMRDVSGQSDLNHQVVALRSTALLLVHRKAVFDYLLGRDVTGSKRQRFFTVFYADRDYADAVVTEHHNYVRCCSSYLCAQYLAEYLMEDAALQKPLQVYEHRYAEYFRAFCASALAETEAERLAAAPQVARLPALKRQLAEARDAILQLPAPAGIAEQLVDRRHADMARAVGRAGARQLIERALGTLRRVHAR